MKNRLYYILIGVVLLLASCSSDKPDNIEPLLHTLQAADISRTEATLYGKCSVAEGVDMPHLWFSYGSNESMAFKQDAIDGADGNVSLHIVGLMPSTTYYYMLQGSNGTASLQGEMLSFSTMPNNRPTVGKADVLSSSPMSVIIGYSIEDDGGDPITLSGCRVACQDSGNTAEEQLFEQTGVADEKGIFHLLIDGLLPNTTYSIKPFAINRNGEAEGDAIMYTTSSAVVLGEAGVLSTLIGNNISKYTVISLAGPLNGDDLRTLRAMAGRDFEDNPTEGKLADIDMSGARIVAGGAAYGASRYTEDDVVGTALFQSCSGLRNIQLPMETVKIEKDAFKDCTSLCSITVPASVAELTPSAGCISLESISVSAANTNYSSVDGVLMNGDGTGILWFPMGKKGEFTLPSTVTTIGDYAFRDCNIERFVFADGLKEIGQCVFYNSKVKEVVMPSTLLQLPTGTFQKCANLTSVRLGENVELISEYVFSGCPLANLYISAPMPPVCYKNTFATSGNDFTKTCRLHVPKGRKPFYRNNAQWKVFANIVDDL